MSQYIENNLGKDERIIIKVKKNPLCLIVPAIWMVLLLSASIVLGVLTGGIIISSLLIFVVAGICPFFICLLKYLSISLALTNKRVVGKIGIFRVNTLDIHIDKIDRVQIEASILGNLFKYFSLRVVSVGGGDTGGLLSGLKKGKEVFVGISNAPEFKNAVMEAVEAHAEEARKAQATEIAKAMRGEIN